MLFSELQGGLSNSDKLLNDSPRAKALKILLIDNNLYDAFFVQRALDKISVECAIKHSESGKKALEYLHALSSDQWPDLILLDIRMPGLNGFEVLELLKENPRTANIPVVMHTGSLIDKDRKKAISLGAVDFVTKTANCSEIVKRVRQFQNSFKPEFVTD